MEQKLYWVFFDEEGRPDSSFQFELAARSHAIDSVDGDYVKYAYVVYDVTPSAAAEVVFEYGQAPLGLAGPLELGASGPRTRLSVLAENR